MEACQVKEEVAYYGHLILRLLAGLVLLYTARIVCKGRVTMEQILFSFKHHRRFLDSHLLELLRRLHECMLGSRSGKVRS
jgi:hypothetical protein